MVVFFIFFIEFLDHLPVLAIQKMWCSIVTFDCRRGKRSFCKCGIFIEIVFYLDGKTGKNPKNGSFMFFPNDEPVDCLKIVRKEDP